MHGLGLSSPAPLGGAAPGPLPSPAPKPENTALKLSIAQLTEQQVTKPGVTITYVSSFREQAEGDGNSRRFGHTVKQMRHLGKAAGPAWEHGTWHHGTWTPDEDVNIPASVWHEHNKTTQRGCRCGFSWDDAAAKANVVPCKSDGDCKLWSVDSSRWTPGYDENGKWLGNAKYSCYKDLPDYQRSPQGDCETVHPWRMSDLHCQLTCGASAYASICSENCECRVTSEAWDPGAAIQGHDSLVAPSEMPKKNHTLLQQTRTEYDQNPSGLPACRWRPAPGCSRTNHYECFDGPASSGTWGGTACSHHSWFGNGECHRSCVHVSLLKPAPYYAVWEPGPHAHRLAPRERRPLYEHDADRVPNISMADLDVTMSRICKSTDHTFLAVSWYSSNFQEKALRLVRSCDRVGVCCKAMLLPPSFGGADEGTLPYRFATISAKPAFVREQMRLTDLPIVYLDCVWPPLEPGTT